MNLLIVSYHDPRSNVIGATRIRKFAEHLAGGGCSVKVLSTSGITTYPDTAAAPAAVNPPGTTPEPMARRRATMPSPASLADHLPERWRRRLSWVFRHLLAFPEKEVLSVATLLRHSRGLGSWTPDVVFASGPPFSPFLAARRIARRHHVPWVADYRDLWTLSTYYLLGPVRRRLDRVLEASLLRSAVLVTTVSGPLAEDVSRCFGVRVEVVLNGYDPDDLAALPPSQPSHGLPLRLSYSGEIYEGRRDPEPLFEALAALGVTAQEVLVEFTGNTVHLVRAAAQRHGVEHLIRCGPRVPMLESLALQRRADVLLLLMWNHPGERGVYTGKLFEYLGARRPILMLGYPHGVAAQLVQDRSAGVVANDVQAIGRAVQHWVEVKRGVGSVPALPEAVAEGLTRQEQSQRLKRLLLPLATGTGRAVSA